MGQVHLLMRFLDGRDNAGVESMRNPMVAVAGIFLMLMLFVVLFSGLPLTDLVLPLRLLATVSHLLLLFISSGGFATAHKRGSSSFAPQF